MINLITKQDIYDFHEQEGNGQMPTLLKHLYEEFCTDVKAISFSSDDKINKHNYDLEIWYEIAQLLSQQQEFTTEIFLKLCKLHPKKDYFNEGIDRVVNRHIAGTCIPENYVAKEDTLFTHIEPGMEDIHLLHVNRYVYRIGDYVYKIEPIDYADTLTELLVWLTQPSKAIYPIEYCQIIRADRKDVNYLCTVMDYLPNHVTEEDVSVFYETHDYAEYILNKAGIYENSEEDMERCLYLVDANLTIGDAHAGNFRSKNGIMYLIDYAYLES